MATDPSGPRDNAQNERRSALLRNAPDDKLSVIRMRMELGGTFCRHDVASVALFERQFGILERPLMRGHRSDIIPGKMPLQRMDSRSMLTFEGVKSYIIGDKYNVAMVMARGDYQGHYLNIRRRLGRNIVSILCKVLEGLLCAY